MLAACSVWYRRSMLGALAPGDAPLKTLDAAFDVESRALGEFGVACLMLEALAVGAADAGATFGAGEVISGAGSDGIASTGRSHSGTCFSALTMMPGQQRVRASARSVPDAIGGGGHQGRQQSALASVIGARVRSLWDMAAADGGEEGKAAFSGLGSWTAKANFMRYQQTTVATTTAVPAAKWLGREGNGREPWSEGLVMPTATPILCLHSAGNSVRGKSRGSTLRQLGVCSRVAQRS